MARLSTVTGLLLCALTMGGLIGASSGKIATAFIPMIAGIPLVIFGIVAHHLDHRRRALQAAAAVTLSGAVLSGGRTLFVGVELLRGESVNRFALLLTAAMAAICVAFLLSWMRGARRERESQAGTRT